MINIFSLAFRRCLLGASIAVGATAFGHTATMAQEKPSVADYAAEQDPESFDDATEAVEAFKAALAANDFDALASLLGLDPAAVKNDEGVTESYEDIRERAAERIIVRDTDVGKVLELGNELWPFPFPIAEDDGGQWAFDTYAGLDEIIARRVGENELEAIATMNAYVDAQREYASEDRNGDGVLEYAQKLISSDGQTDGLYWPAEQGDGESPAGNLDQGELDDVRAGDGYFGYKFRILKGQGGNIAGGAYDYVINGHMIAGFALIAWPVDYGESGVNSFVVSHQGIVYQIDLGDSTEAIVPYIDRFNPDENWSVTGPAG